MSHSGFLLLLGCCIRFLDTVNYSTFNVLSFYLQFHMYSYRYVCPHVLSSSCVDNCLIVISCLFLVLPILVTGILVGNKITVYFFDVFLANFFILDNHLCWLPTICLQARWVSGLGFLHIFFFFSMCFSGPNITFEALKVRYWFMKTHFLILDISASLAANVFLPSLPNN